MNEFKTSDGLRLDFKTEDQGPAVLCLPGLTRDLSDFDEFAAATSGIQLVRLTSRGRKGSDFDPNFANYNIVQESRDVVEFMDFMGLEKAIIIGTSRGGFISMVLAATVPERLAGVLLNDIGPELDPLGMGRIMDYLGVAPKATNLDELVKSLKTNMAQDFPKLSDEKWAELAKRWFKVDSAGVNLTYDPKIRDAMLEQAKKPMPDLWPLFDMMADIPLALVRGENSDLLSIKTTEKIQTRRPDMIYANIPDRGHVPFLDEPAALAAFEKLLKAAK
ncbi:MAG: alpha/beta hydrolase [Rhodobacteraceae bacterium]|nr:alpha/beta hydrolase [Paracoccaceae bacterium]